MKLKIISFIIIAGSLVSCNTEPSVIFSSESFTETNLKECNTVACPEVTINYDIATGDKEVSEKINNTISSNIIEALYMEEGAPEAKTIAEAVTDFIKMYRMHSAEFPDMAAEYEAQINVTSNFTSKDIASVEFKKYLYTGGAHGYGSTSFLNFNNRTGELISSEELFKNISDFTAFAEENFRRVNNIKASESINSTGFWFENDQFYLPESIGLTETEVILIYNQYDIASYADGPIELKISREGASNYLKF